MPSRRPLGECTEFVLDGTHGSPPRTATGVPVLSATNVRDGRLSYQTDRYTSLEEYEAYRRRLHVQLGDVLLTIVGTIGRTAVVDDARPHVFQRSVAVLRPRASVIESRYLFHALNTADVTRQLAARTNKSAQAGVYLGSLKEVEIPVPPIREQRRIADILDKADVIRRKRKEVIALTEGLLRSTFLEMFGDPVTNPKRLEPAHLRDVLEIPLRNGLSPASAGAHDGTVLTLSAITRGRFDLSSAKSAAFAHAPSPDVYIDKRDFLICRGNGNRELLGVGIFPTESKHKVVFPDTMIAARVDQHRIGRRYLETLWKSRLLRSHVEASARTTNGTFKINQTAVESAPVLLPSPSALAAFESFATKLETLRERQLLANAQVNAMFASLIDRCFGGQPRRGEQPEAAC